MTPIERRMLLLGGILFLIAGAAVGFAAIPQNTISHNHGATFPTLNATLGYWVGTNQIVSTARAAAFVTVDTGQGANELYDMDQNVLTTSAVAFSTVNTGYGANELYEMNQDVLTVSNVTFNRVNATEYFLGPVNKTDIFRYPYEPYSYLIEVDNSTGTPVYYAKNGTTEQIEYSGTDYAPIMRSLDVEGNHILIKNGGYLVNSDILITQDNVEVEAESRSAVLTAKDQPQTTTTAGVNLGDTVIPVVSSAGFSVGEKIQIERGAGQEQKYIQSMTANTITVTVPLTAGHALGVNIDSVMCIFYVTGDGVTIRNIKLDGNSANWPFISPECGTAYEIDYYCGHHLLVENVEITNSRHRPFRGSGDYLTLRNCYFWNMSTSGGVHIEGVSHIWENNLIEDNVFIMPDGIGTATPAFMANGGIASTIRDNHIYGHASFRRLNGTKIENNIIEPNDYAYRTNLYDSNDCVVSKNVFDGEELRLYADDETNLRNKIINNEFDGDGSKLTVIIESHGTEIKDNTFYNITDVIPLEIGGTAGTRLENIDISNNLFYESPGASSYTIRVYYVTGVTFDGNKGLNGTRNDFHHNDKLDIINNRMEGYTSFVFSISTDNQNVLIDNNHLYDCTSRGISLTAGTTYPNTPIVIGTNILGATTPYLNDGTYLNVQSPSVKGTFTLYGGGSAGETAPVINTSPGGVDIDANDEFAYTRITLPAEAQYVVQIKIWAYSNVVEAANNMLLRVVAHGATGSELWSGNAIDVTNKPSVEEGAIVQYDVVHWVITLADDAQIGTLRGGDYIELMVVGEAASAPDIATDALFGGYEIEYV